jgi:acetyltransferase
VPSSLDPIFAPRSVAVVGASRARDSIGWAIVRNLVDGQFAGTIFPVNPKATSIHSLKCYPTLAAIPDPVDLVMVVVPRGLVESIVDQGLAIGARGFVVITAGFGETSAEGRRIEERRSTPPSRPPGPRGARSASSASRARWGSRSSTSPSRSGSA